MIVNEIVMVSWNCDGISNLGTQALLVNYLQDKRPHLFALQETKLNGQPVYFPSYKVFRRDRNSDGGGVALLVRSDISARSVSVGNTYSIESVMVEVLTSVGKLLVASVYSPHYTPGFASHLAKFFGCENVILMGDLNARSQVWNGCVQNSAGKALLEFLELNPVRVLHPAGHTRLSSRGDRPSTIDFFITNSVKVLTEPVLVDCLFSDHFAVLSTIRAAPMPAVLRPNYKKANWVLYRQVLDREARVLGAAELSEPSQVVDAAEAVTNAILSARDVAVPVRAVTWETRDTPDDTLAVIREIRRLNRRLKNCPAVEVTLIRGLLKIMKVSLRTLAYRDRNKRWSEFTGSLSTENPKNYWRIAKRMRNGPTKSSPILRPDGTTAVDPVDKAEIVADTFLALHEPGRVFDAVRDAPIVDVVNRWLAQTANVEERPFPPFTSEELIGVVARWRPFKCPGLEGIQNVLLKHFPMSFFDVVVNLFNAIVVTRCWPSVWKHAKLIALLKRGKPAQVASSYRPIALLPALSKALERLINDRLVVAMSEKELLQDWQFGFRYGHSAPQAAMRLFNVLKANKERKLISAALLLDVEAAFPSLWREGLLYQMIEDDIPAYIIHTLNAFLTDRSFVVATSGVLSSRRHHDNGMPQGSCLSPSCYAYHISKLRTPSCVQPFLFADDTAAAAGRKQARAVVTDLNKAHESIVDHYDKWRIKVNSGKTEVLWVPPDGKRCRRPVGDSVRLGNVVVPTSNLVRYLGLWIDAKVKFNRHAQTVRDKGATVLAALYPLMSSNSGLSPKNKLLLYKTCVRPIVSYACPIWHPVVARTHKAKLQILQNRAIKQSLGYVRRTPTADIHEESGMSMVDEYLESLSSRFFERCAMSDYELIRDLAVGFGLNNVPP